MPEPILYSRKLAAAALSISLRSLTYLLTAQKIATVRVGKKNLIPAAELKRFARKGLSTLFAQPIRFTRRQTSTYKNPQYLKH